MLAGLKERFRSVPLAQSLYRYLWWYGRLQFEPSPWSVAIETAGPCNRKCGYCPVVLHQRTGEMSRDLFEKIISDLAAIGFDRTISFHFYNEPLLDERLPELVAHAKSKLPLCVMDLFTNGDFLTPRWIEDLVGAGIQIIRVSLHSPNSEKHVRRVLEKVEEPLRRRVVFDSFFDRDESGGFLYNRVEISAAPVEGSGETQTSIGCSLVNSMAINFEGRTALCCNDFFASNGHGSVAEASVGEIWKRSRPVRKRIYLGYFDKPICQVCNVGPQRV